MGYSRSDEEDGPIVSQFCNDEKNVIVNLFMEKQPITVETYFYYIFVHNSQLKRRFTEYFKHRFGDREERKYGI